MSPRFPGFFLIGAPKCGTTSLYAWLQEHPDTYLPIKEPGFFSPDLLDVRDHPEALQSEAEYLARLCPPEAHGKLVGEATPKYLYSDAALAALAPYAGHIKLIVMLRNPVDLAIAMHAQNLRQGREYEPDFARAWFRGPAIPDDKLTDYSFWGQPGVWLERWLATFPDGDIKVLILEEEMSTNPSKAYADTLTFLGLAPHQLDKYGVENPRRLYRSPYLQGVSRRARRAAYSFLHGLGVTPQGTGLLRLFDRLNGSRPGRQEVSFALRTEISEVLMTDAKRLGRLLGRGDSPWPNFEWEDICVVEETAGGAN